MATNHIYTDQELLEELIERNEKRQVGAIAATGQSDSMQSHILQGLNNALWMVENRNQKERERIAHIKAMEVASECLIILDGCRRKENLPIRDPIDPWDRIVRLPQSSTPSAREVFEVCISCAALDPETCARRRCYGFINRQTKFIVTTP